MPPQTPKRKNQKRFLQAIVAFAIAGLTGPTAHAFDDGAHCFNKTSAFFTSVQRTGLPPEEMSATIRNACGELKNEQLASRPSIWERIESAYIDDLQDPATGGIASQFATLNGSETQRRYKAELLQIAKIPNPLTRIEKVYELSVRYQGVYDNQHPDKVKFQTPGRLLDRAQRQGSAGVCRDFAALFQWSLSKVQFFGPGPHLVYGPHDFYSKKRNGNIFADGKFLLHSWVEIVLPTLAGPDQPTGHIVFDLDTTIFRDQFSILFPRRSGLQRDMRESLSQQCDQINSCLIQAAKANVQDAAAKKLVDFEIVAHRRFVTVGASTQRHDQ